MKENNPTRRAAMRDMLLGTAAFLVGCETSQRIPERESSPFSESLDEATLRERTEEINTLLERRLRLEEELALLSKGLDGNLNTEETIQVAQLVDMSKAVFQTLPVDQQKFLLLSQIQEKQKIRQADAQRLAAYRRHELPRIQHLRANAAYKEEVQAYRTALQAVDTEFAKTDYVPRSR